MMCPGRALVFVLVAATVVGACDGPHPPITSSAVPDAGQVRAQASLHAAELRAVDAAGRSLNRDWDSVTSQAMANTADYRLVATTGLDAAGVAHSAGIQFDSAANDWAEAGSRWTLVRGLIVAAATVDANALAGRAAGCAGGASTRAYRRRLARSGSPVAADIDVDHIVPRSWGGADHPSNYQLLPASLNRSLGGSFGVDKCLGAGLTECVGALAISLRCGSLGRL